MKREVLAVGLAFAVAAGCSSNPPEQAPPHYLTPPAAREIPAMPEGHLPNTLPAAVRGLLGSVVSVHFNHEQSTDGQPTVTKTQASGIKVGDGLVLSAGHAFLEDGNANQASPVLSTMTDCRTTSMLSLQNPSQPVVASAKRIVASYSKGDDALPDYSLAQVRGGQAFDDAPAAKVGGDVVPAQDLYMANQEPAASGTPRTSDAVYGAIVLERTRNTIEVVTGIQSYEDSDDKSRPGASGGPVFDAGGVVEGILVGTGGSPSEQQVEDSYGVRIPGVPSNAQLQVEVVQKVDTTLLNPPLAALSAAPSCQ